MKYLLTTLFALIFINAQSQDFYDLNTIQTIEITFAESNWDQLLDNAYAADAGYILAQSVTLNGEKFDSIGVKYKGNSTYSERQDKNPFHIELDTYKDHEYDGYTDIKLSNVAKDPSFLREVLSYQVLRQYMDAPLSNYANVYVNGNLLGLYSNSEAISKKFVKSRFGSKKNTFIKCNPIEGAGPNSTDLPDLVYQGQDSTDYYASYELKSDAGWQELIDLCDTLANHTDHIEKILDVNRTLWMHAFNNVLVNLDSYSGGFTQNYYLYRDDSGRFLPIVWDLNESFGQFSMTGSIRLNNTTSKQQMTHLLHENDADFPLIQKLLAIPTYKRMYIAHCKTILLENFDNGAYLTVGQELQDLIDASVQADNNKFFTYNNFTSNFTSDVSAGGGPGGGGSYPGITTLMDGRSSYLLGLSDFIQTEPTISNIELSNASPTVDETLSITATITDANTVFLGYRSDNEDAFEQIEMFDDGAHNDGAANDGVYGVDITADGALNEYYIYGENDNAGMFSPRRAEHEFYNFTATTMVMPAGDLVINEFMASNGVTASDQDGEFDDWVELYNNTSSAIDLEGYALSDDSDNLQVFVFPAGTEIAANGYLIIWTDGDPDQAGLHADFKLSSGGENIFLSDASGNIIDEITYTDQTEDISYGRFPNGTGDFQTMNPTFNEENTSATDNDQDGYPAGVDCDDNNPLISVQGDACDDGDSNTNNDVIQADCTCAGTTAGDLVINEFMASNGVTASDQDGEFDDWVELYNNSSSAIDLGGYALSDDSDNLQVFVFPAGTEIAANGYLIIWTDGDPDQAGLHADFKLSSGGETIFLSDASGNILDEVTYSDQSEDISFGRFPNGTGDFQTMSPTFNAENSNTSSTSDFASESFILKAFPNPARNTVTISASEELSGISIYNLQGQKVLEQFPNWKETKLDVSRLGAGLYFIKAVTTEEKVVTQKMMVKK